MSPTPDFCRSKKIRKDEPGKKERIKPKTVARYKLDIEYDGSRFRGWQKQGEKELRTVQGTLLTAAAALFPGQKIDVQGNGRTDAGVHALDYVAHLDIPVPMDPSALMERLDKLLPADIAVRGAERVDPRFHARHNCLARSYLYQLLDRKSVFARRYAWCLAQPLDIEKMRQAAALFVGMHDFAAFAEKQELKKSTRVLVSRVDVDRGDRSISVRVLGSHFLWHMVRRMVGVLVDVGSDSLEPEAVRQFLNSMENDTRRFTAPAQGLFFEKAFYCKEELDCFLADAPATAWSGGSL